MVFVKICGITRVEDATAAARYGAAAVGFIFAESPRRISVEEALSISKSIPGCLTRIGVFVNENPVVVMRIARKAKLDVIQLHGEEEPEYCKKISLPVIKTIKIHENEFFPNPEDYFSLAYAFLLDTYDPNAYGGTGKTFRWEMIERIKEYGKPVIVAGGLNKDNVGELIRKYRPFGVDVSSGVEVSPGIKSASEIKKFIEKVREAEKNTVFN